MELKMEIQLVNDKGVKVAPKTVDGKSVLENVSTVPAPGLAMFNGIQVALNGHVIGKSSLMVNHHVASFFFSFRVHHRLFVTAGICQVHALLQPQCSQEISGKYVHLFVLHCGMYLFFK